MTNTAKSLIAGVLLVELGFASYLLFPKDDQPPVETDAGMNSLAITAGVNSRFRDAHVAAGSVVRAAPLTRSTDDIAEAPLPFLVGNVAPEPGLARTLRKDRDQKHSRLNIRLVRSNQLTFRSPRVRRQPRRRESSVSVTVSIAPARTRSPLR